jgi:hypothetical protein
LLNLDSTEDPTHSIFSSDLVTAISQKYLTSRYQTGIPTSPINPHPAIAPGQSIKFGLALSNLDGVDYTRPVLNGAPFTYTRFQDQIRRELPGDASGDTLGVWDELRQAAVASGAFPFAFRVAGLQRTLADYTGTTPPTFPQLNMNFAYTDGGVFQNEPLGMAKDFVDQIDNHQNSDTRFYLFIAPGAKGSAIASAATLLTPANANLLNFGKGLLGAIYNQARFHDWIMAERVNAQITLFNSRASALQQAILTGGLSPAVIGPAAAALIAQMQAADPQLTAPVVAAALTRLQTQFATEYAALLASPGGLPAANAWLQAILVLEISADIGPNDEMNIFGITASDQELAGSSISAFAGFFDQGIRQHDYDVGRNKAKAFIAAQNTPGPGLQLPFNYTPGPPIPLDPTYSNFDVSKLSVDERENLKDRFSDRINTLLNEIGVPWILRKPLMTFYVNGKIASFLKLTDADLANTESQ